MKLVCEVRLDSGSLLTARPEYRESTAPRVPLSERPQRPITEKILPAFGLWGLGSPGLALNPKPETLNLTPGRSLQKTIFQASFASVGSVKGSQAAKPGVS